MAKLLRSGSKNNLLSRLAKVLSRTDKNVESLETEGQYQVFDQSMIIPVAEAVSTRDAIKVYKKHMVAVGYFEKDELGDFVSRLREEIAAYEQELKEEVLWAKETLLETKKETKSEVKKLKKLLSKCDEDEKDGLLGDIGSAEEEVASAVSDLKNHSEILAQFKKDKRGFLVNYINTEIHGHGWRQQG